MKDNNEIQLFGRNTERMFKEIDMIRKKQIELANEHIGLEAIDEMSPPVLQASGDSEDDYRRNLEYFNKKEIALKNLMDKLDALGQIMNDFREAPDLNPHTVLQEITSAPTSSAQNQQDVKRMSSINGATPNSDPNTPKPLNINSPIPLYSFDQSPN